MKNTILRYFIFVAAILIGFMGTISALKSGQTESQEIASHWSHNLTLTQSKSHLSPCLINVLSIEYLDETEEEEDDEEKLIVEDEFSAGAFTALFTVFCDALEVNPQKVLPHVARQFSTALHLKWFMLFEVFRL